MNRKQVEIIPPKTQFKLNEAGASIDGENFMFINGGGVFINDKHDALDLIDDYMDLLIVLRAHIVGLKAGE